jgi:hypothetical protein
MTPRWTGRELYGQQLCPRTARAPPSPCRTAARGSSGCARSRRGSPRRPAGWRPCARSRRCRSRRCGSCPRAPGEGGESGCGGEGGARCHGAPLQAKVRRGWGWVAGEGRGWGRGGEGLGVGGGGAWGKGGRGWGSPWCFGSTAWRLAGTRWPPKIAVEMRPPAHLKHVVGAVRGGHDLVHLVGLEGFLGWGGGRGDWLRRGVPGAVGGWIVGLWEERQGAVEAGAGPLAPGLTPSSPRQSPSFRRWHSSALGGWGGGAESQGRGEAEGPAAASGGERGGGQAPRQAGGRRAPAARPRARTHTPRERGRPAGEHLSEVVAVLGEVGQALRVGGGGGGVRARPVQSGAVRRSPAQPDPLELPPSRRRRRGRPAQSPRPPGRCHTRTWRTRSRERLSSSPQILRAPSQRS